MKFLLLLPFTIFLASSFPTVPTDQVPNPELSVKYYEGDIILDDDEGKVIREKRGAPDASNPNRKWPTDQVVSYKIESGFNANNTRMIKNAFKFWTDNSCLTYEENGPTTPYLRVFDGGDCASYLGRKAGATSQDINIGEGCFNPGTLQHEIAHSMGLDHTQTRFDRDSYITVNTYNINPAALINFHKKTSEINNNFGVPYDYSSVLHYDAFSFSVDDKNKETIIAHDENAQFSMGQRDRAAFSDIVMVNAVYECAKKCPSPSVECQNGGIINSKTCNTCICPYMFAGADCSERQTGRGFDEGRSGCGADLEASSEWQNLQGTAGVWGFMYQEHLSECFWNIKAPEGRKIEVRLNKSALTCQAKCFWNGVELFMKGFTVGGYRFCCMDKASGKIIQSDDNLISVRAYSVFYTAPINVDFRFV